MRDLNFERIIKSLPEYQTLIFQHGERLFIQHNSEYEILSVRLAYRMHVFTTLMKEGRNPVNKIKAVEEFDLYVPLQCK